MEEQEQIQESPRHGRPDPINGALETGDGDTDYY